MNVFAAFLHHCAVFTLVAALAVELVLLGQPLTLHSARTLRRCDALYGWSAGLILLIGSLRVMYLEKGAAYYLHSGPFLAKMTLFALVGLLSIYPTVLFLGWGKALKAGQLPAISTSQQKRLRRLLQLELGGVALIALNAALMAKGIQF